MVGWHRCPLIKKLSGNRVSSVDDSDVRPPSGSISPALVGITLVAVLLLSTQSEQQNDDMNSIGSRCRRRDSVSLEACREADIVLAFVETACRDTATRPTEMEDAERNGVPTAKGSLEYAVQGLGKRGCCNIESPAFVSQDEIEGGARKSDAQIREATREESFFDKGMGEGVRGEIGAEVREFVGLWSRVQAAVWHVNTCLGVLGLLGTDRDGLGYCTALSPLSLHPAFALEVFLWRRNYLWAIEEQKCRRFPSKIHDHGSEDHLREDRPCPCDRLLKCGRGRHGMGRREAYCCCWWYSMTERYRGDCNWASRMEIVLGAVSACYGS